MDPGVVSFNGKRSDELEHGKVKFYLPQRQILPATRDRTMEIQGKDGVFDFGRDLEEGIMPCEFTLIAANRQDLRKLSREMAAWLNVTEVKELIFDDEPDVFYLARPVRAISPESMVKISKGQVRFFVPDACAYSVDLKEYTQDGGTLLYYNEGTLSADFVIEATIQEETESFGVAYSETEYLTFEYSFEPGDIIKLNTSHRRVYLNDDIDLRPYKTLDSGWFTLPPGGGGLDPEPFGTHLELTFRESYR